MGWVHSPQESNVLSGYNGMNRTMSSLLISTSSIGQLEVCESNHLSLSFVMPLGFFLCGHFQESYCYNDRTGIKLAVGRHGA